MKAEDQPRFDIDMVRDLAGEKAFARGEAYHRGGLVRILSLKPSHVLAQVAGTQDYRTVLTGRAAEISGECSCPAFADWGFCKHMVATVLTANAMGTGLEAESAGALAHIRDHLRGKGIDTLVEMIVGLAEHDPALFRKLDMAAAAVHADDKTLRTRLRSAIDGATRTIDFVGYWEAAGWAAGVDEVLDTISDLSSERRAGLVVELAEHAIDRIESAAESIDDSDGDCGALLFRAREIHHTATCVVRPEPLQLARDLFAREMEDDYGTFESAAALYADVLGAAGLAEYRRLAADAWKEMAPRSGSGARQTVSGNYDRLKDILDFFAEREGDLDARIALRAKDLSSPWNYFKLAQFCREQGRADEALRYAEEGLWVFEDETPDERLVIFAADLLAKAGRGPEAEAHLLRAFEKSPSLELYVRLRKLVGKAACTRAVALLRARLIDEKRSRWHAPADLLIRLLMHETMFDAAWDVVREHGASGGVTLALAGASEAMHPQEALKVYSERVEALAAGGGNPAYEEAVKLIAHMAELREPARQADFVAALKQRHRRKRNFMKLLETGRAASGD